MSKARSPRYPSIGLREAIEKAKAVYENDYQNKIPKLLVGQHMGYGTLNGKSLGVISAVSKYGLLDGGRDQMWVTDRTLLIIHHPPGHPERVAALMDAAREPDLFAELLDQFPGKVSDAALRSYLITKRKFLPDAADTAIRSFRETTDLIEAESGGVVAPNIEDEDREQVPPPRHSELDTTVSQPATQPQAVAPSVPSTLAPGTPYKIELTGDRIRVVADVDLAGLKKLIRILQSQTAHLEPDEVEIPGPTG